MFDQEEYDVDLDFDLTDVLSDIEVTEDREDISFEDDLLMLDQQCSL